MIDGHNWIGWEKQKPTKWERYRWENAIYEEKKRIKEVANHFHVVINVVASRGQLLGYFE